MAPDESALTVCYLSADPTADDPLFAALSRETGYGVVGIEEAALLERVERGGVDAVVCRHRPDALDAVAVLEAVRGLDGTLPFVLVAEDGTAAHRAVAADVSEYVPLSTEGRDAVLRRLRAALDDGSGADATEAMSIPGLGGAEELALKERAMDEAPAGITITDADRPDNPLVYVNDQFEAVTGYHKGEVVGRNCRFLQGTDTDPDDVAVLRAAVEEERADGVVLRNYRKDGEEFWNEVHVAPIRHDDGTVCNYVGFQLDVTERVEAKLALEDERETLAHVLDRIEGLLGDVTSDLVRGRDRDEIEEALCRRTVAEDTYQFAWVGRRDRTADAIVPSAWDGAWEPTRDELTVGMADDVESAAREAVEHEAVTIIEDEEAIAGLATDREWIADEAVGTVASIPLTYKDTTYGVLTVCTAPGDDLTAPERVVLESIARATATAINALERGRLITATNVVELEFDLAATEHFFVALSAAAGCRLDYRGAVTQDDGSLAVFFETDGDVEALVAAGKDHPTTTRPKHVTGVDDNKLVAVTVTDSSLVEALGRRGGRIRSLTAEDGSATLTVDIPTAANPREFVELIEERYPESSLRAFRERERPPTTKGEFIADLTETLTARQLTALQTAYVSGYFEADRSVSGDTLAEAMDVSPSTFHQHLRAAERKLVGEFFAHETGPSQH